MSNLVHVLTYDHCVANMKFLLIYKLLFFSRIDFCVPNRHEEPHIHHQAQMCRTGSVL